MNESPKELSINPTKKDDDKPTSLESFLLKEIVKQRKESGHSSHDHSNGYRVQNPGKARPAQESNRALFAMNIIVCLIALAASLLLTILMLAGKIRCSNEGQCTS